ncbi:hypothetical protein pEaSNUABM11_00100 [Erwinia phage pEa_SNUABM_11]|nr:hypothetical protein pEaSNUABM11_00100 [Erwinia phage pEa_SNUABM_11]
MTNEHEAQETAISRMLRKLPTDALLDCYPVGDFLVINGHVTVRGWLEAAADDLTVEQIVCLFATHRTPDPVELAYPHVTTVLGKSESQERLKQLFFDSVKWRLKEKLPHSSIPRLGPPMTTDELKEAIRETGVGADLNFVDRWTKK